LAAERPSFPEFSAYRFSEPHAWGIAVLVDELNAGGLTATRSAAAFAVDG
jgi:hypothetical protein